MLLETIFVKKTRKMIIAQILRFNTLTPTLPFVCVSIEAMVICTCLQQFL